MFVREYHQHYNRTDELRGLDIALGWRRDCMAYTLRYNMKCSCVPSTNESEPEFS